MAPSKSFRCSKLLLLLLALNIWLAQVSRQAEVNRTSSQQDERNDYVAVNKPTNSNYKQQISNATTTTNTRFGRQLGSSAKVDGHKKMPQFAAPITNVSVVLGRDARLVCQVENLGQHQVAWLKEETGTILSIDANIIITNYRIFLIPDEKKRIWALHIKDVQESDRGFYQCQINTSPMKSTSGYLEVVVPPSIVQSQTSQVAEVVEHSNVSVQCKASGHPKPQVIWRRDDNQPIRINGSLLESSHDYDDSHHNSRDSIKSSSTTKLSNKQTRRSEEAQDGRGDDDDDDVEDHGESPEVRALGDINININSNTNTNRDASVVKGERLTLYEVDRSMAGVYVCVVSNDISSPISKRIPIYVKFEPKTKILGQNLSETSRPVRLNSKFELDCLVESFPKANSYWSKRTMPIWTKPEMVVGPKARALTQTRPERKARATSGSASAAASTSSVYEDNAETSRDYVSVKQTPVNGHSYKLKLSIARMQPEDYGEYTCVAVNSLGSSESSLVVTVPQSNPVSRSQQQQQHDSINDTQDDDNQDRPASRLNHKQVYNQPAGLRRSSTGHHVTYDENYLQAIRMRQNNVIVGNSNSNSNNNKNQKSRPQYDANSTNGMSKSAKQHQAIRAIVVVLASILAFAIEL